MSIVIALVILLAFIRFIDHTDSATLRRRRH